MSTTYQVNRHTVRHAVEQLCRLGVLHKVKGRGTFVTSVPADYLEYKISARNRFTENIEHGGGLPGVKVLKAEITEAPGRVAEKLNLDRGEEIYLLKIVRLVNGQPFLLSTMFLPVKHLPGFLDHTAHFSSLFAILERIYDIRPTRVSCSFIAALPEQPEAVILKIPVGVPVLKTESLLKIQGNVLIQFAINCYRGDLARITVDW